MKLEKKKISNIVLILVAGIVLFTPVGFKVQVLMNRLLSFNPTETKIEAQKKVTDYHWQLISLKGVATNFEQEKGEVVVVNFWATWCPPCVAEMPSFQSLYDDYGDKVSFLFIAQDAEEKVSSFLKKKNYNLPVFYENSATPTQLQSKSIPITFVISKSGKIIVSETGAANWNSDATRNLLNKLLAE